MRILFVSQWFQPEPAFKGIDFVRALREVGHEVEVLTGFPNYPGGQLYPGYRAGWFQVQLMDGIRVYRCPLYPSHDRSALRRVFNYVSFALSSGLRAMTLKRPDVVYLYTPPLTAALPAVLLRLLRGVPFVCDVQDLWPDTLSATGMVNRPSILAAVGSWTNFVFRRATRIVVLSPGFKDRLSQRGIRRPITVIPNWAPREIVEARPKPKDFEGEEWEGPFTVTFAGNMGPAQALTSVIDAAVILQERKSPVQFVFIGGGVQVDALKAYADQRDAANVRFLPPRPPAAMPEIFEAADALLVHLRNDPLFEITIPSKTQAYLAAGKPILMGVRGDAARMLEQAGGGIAFEPEDPAALADAVCDMLAMPPAGRARMGEAGRRYYDERLDFSVGVAAMVAELEAAASEG